MTLSCNPVTGHASIIFYAFASKPSSLLASDKARVFLYDVCLRPINYYDMHRPEADLFHSNAVIPFFLWPTWWLTLSIKMLTLIVKEKVTHFFLIIVEHRISATVNVAALVLLATYTSVFSVCGKCVEFLKKKQFSSHILFSAKSFQLWEEMTGAFRQDAWKQNPQLL